MKQDLYQASKRTKFGELPQIMFPERVYFVAYCVMLHSI